jgi:HEAT repeat protein
MTPTGLVLLILRIEGAALTLTLVTIFGYAAWSRAAIASRTRRLAAARGIIATHLESKQLPAGLMTELRALSDADQRHLFVEVAPSVGEAERAWLRGIARDLGTLDSLLADATSSQWWTRLEAARLLTLIDVEPSIMHPLLRDPEGIVRAQAASYVAQHSTPEGIEALLRMLSDPDALCRFAAKDALMRLGGSATPVIVARLRNPNDPIAVPMLEVAIATATHGYLPAAIEHHDDPNPDVRLLVTRLLRGIGGPVAAEHLVRFTADASPKVREAALEGLGYLNHWVASPAIAKLLDDPVSRVRLAAALSLDQLGPTGELLLRRARSKGSEVAAAAASRILDDPSHALAPPALGASS